MGSSSILCNSYSCSGLVGSDIVLLNTVPWHERINDWISMDFSVDIDRSCGDPWPFKTTQCLSEEVLWWYLNCASITHRF